MITQLLLERLLLLVIEDDKITRMLEREQILSDVFFSVRWIPNADSNLIEFKQMALSIVVTCGRTKSRPRKQFIYIVAAGGVLSLFSVGAKPTLSAIGR